MKRRILAAGFILAAVPFAGIEGVLALVEGVLNACTAGRKA